MHIWFEHNVNERHDQDQAGAAVNKPRINFSHLLPWRRRERVKIKAEPKDPEERERERERASCVFNSNASLSPPLLISRVGPGSNGRTRSPPDSLLV